MADQTAALKAFIRPYDPQRDLENAVHVFRETCDASLKYEPAWTLGEYLWCRPYVQLAPRTCFVVDDGSGVAVGYIIGTPDTAAFVEAWRSQFLPSITGELNALVSLQAKDALDDRSAGLLKTIHDPPSSCYGGLVEELKAWPSHLHIDILPSHQSQGFGKHLLKAFIDAVRAEGASGVYLGMTAHNDGAGRFYERNGFRRLPHVLDDGKSGEQGRTATRPDGGATIWQVIDL